MAVLPHEGTYNILFHAYSVPVGSSSRRGYVARPDQVGRYPAVVIIPGIYGLTSFEKDLARRLARHGFVAIAVDPYLTPLAADADFDEAVRAYSGLTDARAMTNIDRTIDFAVDGAADFSVGAPVGIIGVDVGGRFGLLYAPNRHRVGSLVVIQAPLAGDEDRQHTVADALPRIQIPVLGLYGKDDERIPADGVDVAAELNPTGQWIVYDDTGHDFLDPDSESYQPGASSDALARIPQFLQRTLPAPVIVDY